MIITVTLNPAVDKTARVKELNIGGLNRIYGMRSDAGGKGINVSRAISALGGESLAMGFLGGAAGSIIRDTLNLEDIRFSFTEIAGETRTNLKLIADDGTITEINEPGPEIASGEFEALRRDMDRQIQAGDLLVLSGSAPRGVPNTIYAELTELAHSRGAKVLLDADGGLFAEALGAKPDIIKPNIHELMEYCAHRGITPSGADEKQKAASAGRMLVSEGIGEVVISMGAEGALFLYKGCEQSEGGMFTHAQDTFQNTGLEDKELSQNAEMEDKEWSRNTGPEDKELSQNAELEDKGWSRNTGLEDKELFQDVKVLYAPAISVNACSTVGAGDTMAAAYALAVTREMDITRRIRFSVAAAAAAVMTEGTVPPDARTVAKLEERCRLVCQSKG